MVNLEMKKQLFHVFLFTSNLWVHTGQKKYLPACLSTPQLFFRDMLLETNISPPKGTFEDFVPFSKVGYVSFLKGICQLSVCKVKLTFSSN